MGVIKCAVPGCEDRRSSRHRFPVFDQELYEEWLKRIGSKELNNLDPKFVGTNKRICSVHFSNHCRVPNSTKLKNRSLPTLHLPEFKEKPSEDNSILKYHYKTQTISRTELIRYIKDFKPDHEDGGEIKHLHPSVLSVPVASPHPSVLSVPVACPPTCSLPNFSLRCVTIGNSLPDAKPILAHDIHKKPSVDYVCPQFNLIDTRLNGLADTESTTDTVPVDNSTESDDDEVGDCEPVTIDFTYLMKITNDEEIEHLNPSVLSIPVACPPTCSLPNFSSRCGTIGNSLPDTKPIVAHDSNKKPSVDYVYPQFNLIDTRVNELANTETTTDTVPVDNSTESDDNEVGDCEPVTIDFTYLMKITSLPDTPLIEESPQDGPLTPEPPQVVEPKLAADSFQRPASISPNGTVSETSVYGNLTSFDLEELIREHCEDLLTEPTIHLVHTTSYS